MKIFSLTLWFFFILLIISLTEQKILILTQSNLSVFKIPHAFSFAFKNSLPNLKAQEFSFVFHPRILSF
jgi:hypothetical protein